MALQLRRDRLTMTVWVLGTALVALGSAAAVVREYGTHAEARTLLTLALANPSVLAFRGAPNGATTPSVLWFALFSWLAVVVGLMNVLFATRHNRADEERGRRELVAGAPIPRSAPLRASIALGVAFDVVLGVLTAGAFAAGGDDAAGAVAAGASFAVVGVGFLGVGLLAGELAPTSRSANAIGVGVVLASYVLRAAGDALGTPYLASLSIDVAWPSWFSPIGWGEQVLAGTADRLPLLLAGLALALVTVVAALMVDARRDLGESVLPERRGRATAGATLRGVLGLAWRMHRSALASWTVGAAVLGLATASLARAAGQIQDTNPQIAATLRQIVPGGSDQIESLLVGTILLLVALLAAAAGVQGALRLRQEESDGRVEALLAAPVGRLRVMGAAVVVGLSGSVIVMAAAGLLAGVGFAASGAAEKGARALGQAFIDIPAVLVFPAIAALAVAVLPRAAVAIAWGVFAVGIALGFFGRLLDLPQWLIRISPFDHVPTVPFSDWGPSIWLIAIDAVVAAAAVALMRRRDLVS